MPGAAKKPLQAEATPMDPLTWLRALCEPLEGVEEVVAWGHPNFRRAGRTFAVFEVYRSRPCIAVQTSLDDQELLVAQFGFFKAPYTGPRGWVSLWVDGPVPWELLGDLVLKAHSALSTATKRRRGAAGLRQTTSHSTRNPKDRP